MIRVGVLRGGTGPHFEQSLATGAYVLKHLPRDYFDPVDIFVDREGVWHMGGKPISHTALAQNVDVVWNALHGYYGADGKVQQLLQSLSVPYVGTEALPSAVTMHERMLNEQLALKKLPARKGVYIESWDKMPLDEAVALAGAKLSPPWIVMPVRRAENVGEYVVKTRHELLDVLRAMREAQVPVFVEEAVMGREASVVTVSGFRGQKLYTFLPIMADGRATNARLSEHHALQDLAKKAHEVLGLGHYSRMQMVVTPKGTIVIRSIETVPDLGKESLLHAALATTGAAFGELARHMIAKAMDA